MESDRKKETFYSIFFSLGSKVLTYILLLVFANLYSPDEFGRGIFALNIRNIIMMFSFIGLPEAIIPFLIRKKNVGLLLKTFIIINVPLIIAGLVFSFFQPWALPLVITFPLIFLTSLAVAITRAHDKYSKQFKAGVWSILVTLILAYFLKSQGVYGVTSAYAAGNLFAFFYLIYPVKKEMKEAFRLKMLKGERKTLKLYFKNAFFITTISGIFVLLGWISSTLLGILSTVEEVARFGVASSIAGVVSVIPTSLSLFMINRAIQIKNKEKRSRVLNRVTRISFFSSLLASLIIISFIPWIIKIFFPQYAGIELSLVILFVGAIFFSSYYIVYSYYIGKMESHKAMLPAIVGLSSGLVLSLILIPIMGLEGAALSNLLAHIAIFFILIFKERMKRIAVLSILALIFAPLTYYSGYFGFLIILMLIPVSLIFKVITKEDLEVLKEFTFKLVRKK
ncbi:MAG: hypothetical protein Q8Q31_03245 [Nanoarchaeota archaeon]|nr:hypothetical protein [Nanoarchaeota archaeon]